MILRFEPGEGVAVDAQSGRVAPAHERTTVGCGADLVPFVQGVSLAELGSRPASFDVAVQARNDCDRNRGCGTKRRQEAESRGGSRDRCRLYGDRKSVV